VQAGAASYVLADQPAQASQALTHIRQASRAALDELRDTIGLLRQPGELAMPAEPTVGISGLPDLVASFSRSGLRIDHTMNGVVRPIPAAADLTAYRVVQESLTNVRKHAGKAPARLRLTFQPTLLHIVVENDGDGTAPPPDHDRTGHGIVGMIERVSAVGGQLDAGPLPDGGFRVRAVLPLSDGGPA
jgi:signal transduction histidine kinase